MALPPAWISVFEALREVGLSEASRDQADQVVHLLESRGWAIVPAYAVDESQIPTGLFLDDPVG